VVKAVTKVASSAGAAAASTTAKAVGHPAPVPMVAKNMHTKHAGRAAANKTGKAVLGNAAKNKMALHKSKHKDTSRKVKTAQKKVKKADGLKKALPRQASMNPKPAAKKKAVAKMKMASFLRTAGHASAAAPQTVFHATPINANQKRMQSAKTASKKALQHLVASNIYDKTKVHQAVHKAVWAVLATEINRAASQAAVHAVAKAKRNRIAPVDAEKSVAHAAQNAALSAKAFGVHWGTLAVEKAVQQLPQN